MQEQTQHTSLIQLFIQRLDETGGCPNHGASEAELAAFEARHELTLPISLRELYRQSNGSENGSLADGYFWFWSLEMITQEDCARKFDQDGKNWHEVVFGDFLIGSLLYAIQFTAQGESRLVLWDKNPQWSLPFGNTLEDFMRMYLDRSADIEGMIF